MHIERLTQIAEWLEGGAKHKRYRFDMTDGVVYDTEEPDLEELSACGAACCIAGAAVQFFDSPLEMVANCRWDRNDDNKVRLEWWEGVMPEARALLELDDATSSLLFTPTLGYWKVVPDAALDEYGCQRDLEFFSDPAWAARVIRKLIATGEVDWEGEYRG